MNPAIYAIAGALVTVLSAFCCGVLLFSKLKTAFSRVERVALEFVTGAACLSFSVFVLAVLHEARKGVFLAVGAALILLAFRYGRRGIPACASPRPPLSLTILFAGISAAYFSLYFFAAWAPEVSPDGSTYHLGSVLRYSLHRGIVPIRDIYGALPKGLEMLFLMAFSIGRHPAAALVHVFFLFSLPLMLISYARRFGIPKAGLVAATLVFVSPVIGKDGSTAYNDTALAAFTFAAFYFVELWLKEKQDRLLIPAGIAAGFSFAIKYTGILVIMYGVSQMIWQAVQNRKVRKGAALSFAAPSLLMLLPWPLVNAVFLHNPVAPFLNSVFPNPYVSPRFERDYTEYLAHYARTSNVRELAFKYTTTGANVDGFLGPMFLLVPLGVVGLRTAAGRRLILAAALLAVPVLFNQGTRFLIPAAPFAALAIGMAVEGTRWAVALLMCLHGLASWPAVASLYCDQNAWRPEIITPAVAVNPGRASKYLSESLGDSYKMGQIVHTQIGANGRIFCFSCPPPAYSPDSYTVWYESTQGRTLVDALWAAKDPTLQPLKHVLVSFPRHAATRIRVSPAQSIPGQVWRIAEMRVLDGGREIPRDPRWRIGALPDPWEAPLAFDNSPVSAWSTESYSAPNAFLEVSFDRPTFADAVVLECARDAPEQIAVQTALAGGGLAPVRVNIQATTVSAPPGMRRAGIEMLKTYGFNYLIIGKSDYYADDFAGYADYWGIRNVAEAGDWTLYHLE